MAKPIKETPILTNRDAVNFYKQKVVDDNRKIKKPVTTLPAIKDTPAIDEGISDDVLSKQAKQLLKQLSNDEFAAKHIPLESEFFHDGYINGYIVGHRAGELAQHNAGGKVSVEDWISVQYRLPEEFESVLVHTIHCNITVGNLCQASTKWNLKSNEPFHAGFITHWMPLPQPPKTK